MLILALEGPSYSGKTSLGRSLKSVLNSHRVLLVPEYMDCIEDELEPIPFKSLEEQLARQEFFLDIDHERMSLGLTNVPRPELIICDRSVHTLLAHAWAVSNIFNIDLYNRFCDRISSDKSINWPNLVAFLDTPQQILEKRYETRSLLLAEDLFKNPMYNEFFREYFILRPYSANVSEIIYLDGTRDVLYNTSIIIRTLQIEGLSQ